MHGSLLTDAVCSGNRECAGPASDVEHRLPGCNARKVNLSFAEDPLSPARGNPEHEVIAKRAGHRAHGQRVLLRVVAGSRPATRPAELLLAGEVLDERIANLLAAERLSRRMDVFQ